MPVISMRKILIAIFIIVLLSRLDLVVATIGGLCRAIYDSFEPLRNCSKDVRYVLTLAFLSLCFLVFWKLFLYKR